MIYVMLGGPATGKGTRSEILSEKFKIPHISTGEILRVAAEKNNAIKQKLSNGELITDDVINELLYIRLSKEDCKNGFVLDGYPRKLDQALALEAMMRKLNMIITEVIELVVSTEIAFQRILGRRECPSCGKSFGVDFPSMNGDYCDECKTKLVKRSDDTEETLKRRIDTYQKLSKPILNYYRKKGILRTIDSSNHPEKVLGVI
ncbi:MAG: nucleoside monophosphate kinase [Clostridia bacterium]|nr:nucleoside monophosphate kinase [Clostridia bacterium]MDD4386395.1 nucleoside monophosphate kinase [Clostridia bacterium]